ncbi:MAG: hypothetical protein KKC72_04255, partial [Alphaproteobacteria bacterium]|nr:hypothetical protein [Alphaproteobacteria bacterium]
RATQAADLAPQPPISAARPYVRICTLEVKNSAQWHFLQQGINALYSNVISYLHVVLNLISPGAPP